MWKTKASIGCVAALGSIVALGGMRVDPAPADPHGGPGVDGDGPDMQFCQLYDLRQFGRVGDMVGLAVATTSWNTGNRDLMWFASPDNRHPFIVPNLYRLKNDRFEQIGQGWIKHGFYALANTQCGGRCEFEPGHYPGDWLGQNCTDTYSSSLNAGQSGLGPRNEVNPWTGHWSYQGSNFQRGVRHEDATDRRLEVHDDDLNPALNQGAEYFCEGYYVILDDIDVMNSASWKEVTPNGQPGGTWTFGMSGSGTRPTDGFALEQAWPGARLTMLAQELPVIEFVSPDGRCLLGAKATANGNGTWHYEYALLNIDMDRKVGSFTVPLPPNTNITNIGFHAVESRNEGYTNTPWQVDHRAESITWYTDDNNPIRWGTMYNFRFDADRGPDDVEIILGHYEPGTPESVRGITWGPGNRALGLDIAGECPGQMTATVTGGTPNTQAALVYATGRGNISIPGGPCAGVALDLNGTARQVGPMLQFDASGNATMTMFSVPAEACGGFIQAVGASDCGTSNVAEVN